MSMEQSSELISLSQITRFVSTEALRESSGSLLSLLKAKLPALITFFEHVPAGFRVVPQNFR